MRCFLRYALIGHSPLFSSRIKSPTQISTSYWSHQHANRTGWRQLNASLNLFHSFFRSRMCLFWDGYKQQKKAARRATWRIPARAKETQFCGFFFSALAHALSTWWGWNRIRGETSSRPNHLWFRLTLTVKVDHHQWTHTSRERCEKMASGGGWDGWSDQTVLNFLLLNCSRRSPKRKKVLLTQMRESEERIVEEAGKELLL